MWIGIDDAEILIEEDLLFEKERVDLRVSFLGEGATARAKDKVWDDAIISVFFFLNIYIYICVCVLWYIIYMCVWSEDFSPLEQKGRLNAKHKHVSGSHFLSPSLSLSLWTLSLSLSVQIFHFSLWFEKKRGKKNRIKFLFEKAGIFPRIPPLFVSHVIIITWNYSRVYEYSKERVGEKGEDKRV